jgi:hypothetical protein
LLGLVPRGLHLMVLARAPNGQWLKVKAADETIGWITPAEIGLSSAEIARVPVGIMPITATPVPTAKPSGSTSMLTPTPPTASSYFVVVLDSQPVRDSGGLTIRKSPDITADWVDRAQIGDQLMVFESVTKDFTVWLRVRTSRGSEGWVRQGQSDTLLVKQVEPTTFTVTATPEATGATARPTPYAIAVNVIARVIPPEGTRLKVRRTPSIVVEIAGELDANTLVTIVGGPIVAEGFTWWKVDNGKGLVGWSVEGAGDSKYLVPVDWAQ